MFASSVLAAIVALPFLAQSAAADCTRTYVVKEGDICDAISTANNVSTYQLAALNPKIDANCNNLQTGDTLCLGQSGEDCTATYVVRPNDTCDLIKSQHNVNSTILYANNPQINSDCTNIYVGEVLCVGGTFAAPSPPATMPAVTIPATAVPAVPTTAHAASSAAAPAATPTPADGDDGNDDDGNDDDSNDDDDGIPFCDEL